MALSLIHIYIGSEGLIPLPGTWSKERKQRIMHSRRDAGQAVVAAVEAAREKPRVVVQMSGIDYYPSGNVVMTEESQRGRQFLADVVADYWEPSTAPVEALGVRRVITRMAPLLHLSLIHISTLWWSASITGTPSHICRAWPEPFLSVGSNRTTFMACEQQPATSQSMVT